MLSFSLTILRLPPALPTPANQRYSNSLQPQDAAGVPGAEFDSKDKRRRRTAATAETLFVDHLHCKNKCQARRLRRSTDEEASSASHLRDDAESLNHYTGSGCQTRHQLNAMLTIKHQRARAHCSSIAGRPHLAHSPVPVLLLCYISICLLFVAIVDIVHGNTLTGPSSSTLKPATSSNQPLEHTIVTDRHMSGAHVTSGGGNEQPQTTRQLELKNTTAKNPLQLPEKLSFYALTTTSKESNKPTTTTTKSIKSEESPPAKDSKMELEFLKTSLTRNSSSPVTPRIHKRNKLRFDVVTVDNNNKSSSSDDNRELSRLDDLDSERMDVRHKFTFLVNGKELSLKPPVAESSSNAANEHLPDNMTNSVRAGTKGSGEQQLRKGNMKKTKMNRLGLEFMSSSDSDSGFEVTNSDPSSSDMTSSASSHSNKLDFSGLRTKTNHGRRSASHLSGNVQAPPSSSSSLMSSSSSARSIVDQDEENDDSDESTDSDKGQTATLVLSAELADNTADDSLRSRPEPSSGARSRATGKAINLAWSKPSRSKQYDGDGQQQTSYGKSYGGNADGPQLRFSTLLSDGSSNGRANHSGGQQQPTTTSKPWDMSKYSASFNGRPLAATSAHDNESGYGRASLKKSPYPKAPVSAKSRYSPPVVGGGTKTAVRQDSEGASQEQQEERMTHNNDKLTRSSFSSTLDPTPARPSPVDSGSTISPVHQTKHENSHSLQFLSPPAQRGLDKSLNETGRGSAFGSALSSSSSTSTPDYATVNAPQPHYSSVLEYKTNFSEHANASGSQARPKADSESQNLGLFSPKVTIVQRDLSHKQPFSAQPFPHIIPQAPALVPLNLDLILPTHSSRTSRSGRPGAGPMFDGISSDRGFMRKDPLPLAPPPLPNNNNNIVGNSNVFGNNNNNNNNNNIAHGIRPRGFLNNNNQQQQMELNRSSPIEKMGSIVRSGPILPNPFASPHQLRSLVPAAVALLAQAQEDQQVRAANQLRALLAAQQSLPPMPQNHPDHFIHSRSYPGQNLSEQMMATSNHLGVSHLGPQNPLINSPLGASESNSYNTFHDYPLRGQSGQSEGHTGVDSPLGPGGPGSGAATTMSSVLNDERRVQNDYETSNGYEPSGSSMRNSGGPSSESGANSMDGNSRSSISDVYYRPDQKQSRETSGGSSGGGGGGNYQAPRNSVDPYEDVASGISTSEYERDLADMDEEFNRATFRRPPVNHITSDSYMTVSPDRYESRPRYARRPPSYTFFQNDYMNTAGSVSSMLPRSYAHHQRSPAWFGGPAYADASDLWSDTSSDYSPMGSYLSPSHYWKPRYHQRAYSAAAAAPYLTAAASEQPHHVQPAYNFIPSHYQAAMPTETVSIALSPLAAAAAAAASALAVADKSRHQNNGWLTLPRHLATSSLAPVSAAASNAHATTLPGAAFHYAAYQHPARASPYALGSVPIYALAHPRPQAPLAAAASAAAPSIIPYYHSAGPAIFAYRPTGMIPAGQLLTAASFAYPLRLPVPIPRPPPLSLGPARSIGLRPFYSDLQFAESKSKSNLTNNNNNNNSDGQAKGFSGKGGSLTAMAKNLTRKMFGSASQIRPQHVPPPLANPLYDLFAPSHNSTSNLSSQLVL